MTTSARVPYVVAEYGAVNLYGKVLGGKAKALISIAHLDNRERLEREEVRKLIKGWSYLGKC